MSKKLLIVFYDLNLGGIQRKIIDIINYTQHHYPKVKIILCLQKKEGIFLKEVKSNIHIISPKFHIKRFDMILFTLWLIPQLVKIKPNRILTFMDMSSIPVLFASKLVFVKKSIQIIGEDILSSKYIPSTSFPQLRLYLIKKLYPLSKKIIVQTNVQKSDILQITNHNSKVIVLPNWLPLAYPSKNIIPFNKRQTDIIFIGRLNPQKNITKFIEIINEVSKKIPSISVKIVGSGNQKSHLKKITHQFKLEKNIKFISATSDPQKFYSESKIFLLTSDYEGFPLTLLEAISCHCQPILNKLPEIVTYFDKYKNDIFFNNPAQAANLICHLLSHPNNKIIDYYKNKITQDQTKNIDRYVKHILN